MGCFVLCIVSFVAGVLTRQYTPRLLKRKPSAPNGGE